MSQSDLGVPYGIRLYTAKMQRLVKEWLTKVILDYVLKVRVIVKSRSMRQVESRDYCCKY